MKKSIAGLLFFFVFMFSGGHADGQTLRMNVHASAGIYSPHEGNIDSGWGTAFGFSLQMTRKFSLLLDFDYWRSSVRERAGQLMNGRISVTPFLVSVQFLPFLRKTLTPYIFFGAGMIFASFKMGEYISIPEISISQKVDSGMGLHGGMGAEFLLRKNVSLYAEASYLFRKASGVTTITDMNFGVTRGDFSLSLNSLIFRLGIKYYL